MATYRRIMPLFTHPEEQLDNVRSWNDRYNWGFAPADFARVSSELSALPRRTNRMTPVLVPCFETVHGTFEALWTVVATRFERAWRHPAIIADGDHLRLRDGIRHTPGLRWEIIDFAAQWDSATNRFGSPVVTGTDVEPAHAGVLAAAAHFPVWIREMDGVSVPHVWLEGYQARVTDSGPWTTVLTIGGSRTFPDIALDCDSVEALADHEMCASPVRVEA